MVHNGIEYAAMAAYAEGLNILKNANAAAAKRQSDAETAPMENPQFYRYDLDLASVAEVWRRGSVISSWLLDLTAQAFVQAPDLSDFSGRVSDAGAGDRHRVVLPFRLTRPRPLRQPGALRHA
jgi:6-phosphogluconate dehydrogenase